MYVWFDNIRVITYILSIMQKQSTIDKLCTQLKVAKMVSFNGVYENTLKYSNGSYIYPMGSIIVIENEQGQSFLKGHDNQITAIALANNGNNHLI